MELLTTNARPARLDVVSEFHGCTTNRVAEGRQRGLEERELDVLGQGSTPTRFHLRDSLGVKCERSGETLESLERAGRLGRALGGCQRLG